MIPVMMSDYADFLMMMTYFFDADDFMISYDDFFCFPMMMMSYGHNSFGELIGWFPLMISYDDDDDFL